MSQVYIPVYHLICPYFLFFRIEGFLLASLVYLANINVSN